MLKGKTAVVTGSTSGIGLAIARAPGREGANVMIKWTPLVEKQIPDTMKARNMTADEVKRDVLLEAQPTKEFVTVEQVAGRGAGGLSLIRRGGTAARSMLFPHSWGMRGRRVTRRFRGTAAGYGALRPIGGGLRIDPRA